MDRVVATRPLPCGCRRLLPQHRQAELQHPGHHGAPPYPLREVRLRLRHGRGNLPRLRGVQGRRQEREHRRGGGGGSWETGGHQVRGARVRGASSKSSKNHMCFLKWQ